MVLKKLKNKNWLRGEQKVLKLFRKDSRIIVNGVCPTNLAFGS